MKKNILGSSNHLKIEYLIKHNYFFQKIYKCVMSIFFKLWGRFLTVDEKLVLMNGHGYKYNDSPRAIYEKMIELGIAEEYKIVWALKNPDDNYIPGNAKKIKMDTLGYFKTALKAKYWISCVNIERGLQFKKRNQIYLNTWHGASLNFVGNAVKGRNDFDFRYIDYFCYNGEYEREFIKRDFNVRDEALIPTGYPRNDELYDATEQRKDKLRDKFNIPKGKRIVLYAPTWRESEDSGESFKLAPPIDWHKWEDRLGGEYIVFLRTHPYTTELMNVKFNDFVKDYTNYPYVNDLLIVADVLISDYSCIQFDYAILERPQVCYGYDYNEYKSERGFYIDLENDMPNGVMKNEDEVIEYLVTLNYEKECAKAARFRRTYMEYGGNAAVKCINKVFGKIR